MIFLKFKCFYLVPWIAFDCQEISRKSCIECPQTDFWCNSNQFGLIHKIEIFNKINFYFRFFLPRIACSGVISFNGGLLIKTIKEFVWSTKNKKYYVLTILEFQLSRREENYYFLFFTLNCLNAQISLEIIRVC